MKQKKNKFLFSSTWHFSRKWRFITFERESCRSRIIEYRIAVIIVETNGVFPLFRCKIFNICVSFRVIIHGHTLKLKASNVCIYNVYVYTTRPSFSLICRAVARFTPHISTLKDYQSHPRQPRVAHLHYAIRPMWHLYEVTMPSIANIHLFPWHAAVFFFAATHCRTCKSS